MSLFDDATIQRFRRNTNIRRKFSNYKLINAEEFRSYLNEGVNFNVGTRRNVVSQLETPLLRKETRQSALMETANQIAAEMLAIKKAMCPTVSPHYVESSILRSFSLAYPDYDIIVILKPSIKSPSVPKMGSRIDYATLARKQKISKIVGFLIAQKGECPKYPDAYSVNLICTRERGISAFLLGCYMFSIKSHPEYVQKGLLELSDEYANLNGFCAYRKMGFFMDPDIFTGNCLHFSMKMLPMSVHVDSLSFEDIIARSTTSAEIPDPICKRSFGISPDIMDTVGADEYRTEIIHLYRLYYLLSMLFSKKDVGTIRILLRPANRHVRLLKKLLQNDYEPMSGQVAYQTMKLTFMAIIAWIESGGDILDPGPLPQPIQDHFKILFTLYPPGILSANSLLHYISEEINSTFDLYLQHQAKVAEQSVAPVAAVAVPSAAVASSAESKSSRKTRKHFPTDSSSEVDLESGLGKMPKSPSTPTSDSDSDSDSDPESSYEMHYIFGSTMLGELREKKNMQLMKQTMGKLDIFPSDMTIQKFIIRVTDQCEGKLKDVEVSGLLRLLTVYLEHRKTKKIISIFTLAPFFASGQPMILTQWRLALQICKPKTPLSKDEKAGIQLICDALNTDFSKK
jgi:hypothetical protein